jgi:hypothetical protein
MPQLEDIREAKMRHRAAMAAALGWIALALMPVEAAAQDRTPGLLTAEQLNARQPDSGPLILRGSAVGRKAARAAGPSATRWEVAAGRRLWLVDLASGDLRTCTLRDTTLVDVQELSCHSGSFGRYRRTFGPAFQP